MYFTVGHFFVEQAIDINRLREKVKNSNSVLCERESRQNRRVWILSGSVGCFHTNVVVYTVHWETFLQITLAEKERTTLYNRKNASCKVCTCS
jgi:hypothetical protein